MMKSFQARTLSVLGSILIICGLIAILTIGLKAKNLLIVGLLAGASAWVLAWLTSQNKIPSWTSIAFSLAATIIFAQRALANFWAVIGIVQQEANYDTKNKCTLVILLLVMTIASLNTLMMAFAFQTHNTSSSNQD